MNKKVVIIGSGGHSKVVADVIEASKDIVFGFLDDNENVNIYKDYKYLGKVNKCLELQKQNKNLFFIIAIGNNDIRKLISKNELKYYTAIHPTAIISSTSNIDVGTIIMPNVVINADVKIGKHCIINTGAIVEHDNTIGNYVHVSPQATLCGNVKVGENTHIGAGAIIKNNISIYSNSTIGAGATVVKDIIKSGTYIGVPAKLK